MIEEQPEALPVRLAKRLCDGISTGHDWPNTNDELLRMQSAAELRRLHAEVESLRAQIGQGVPTDEQIMATVGRKGFGFSQSRPLSQQWDQVCELIRAVVRERYTHPAPQQIGQGVPDGWQLVPKEPTLEMMDTFRRHDESALGPDFFGAYRALLASAPPAPQASVVQQKPLTDEQITAGAKALCKRSSEICGVNADDNWNLESEYFKDDARCVLEAAHHIGEKK